MRSSHHTPQEHLAPPSGLPRLLLGIRDDSAMGLEDHLALHGQLPFGRRREHRGAAGLIEQVERAGLRGRGGAAFPTATKLRAVAAARGRPVVVVNAAEGEPASAKDRTLLESLPHLVIDGAVLAALAVGAREVIVCLPATATEALRAAERACAERVSERDGGPQLRVQPVPHRYVAGQETALVNLLNGGPALPTFVPPPLFERGVGRKPTLVNNAETLAHLALIARYGTEWFRELGTPEQPGSALVTLSGSVAYPGVYEIEGASPLQTLIEAAGGMTAPARALLLGGYAGTWLPADRLHQLELSDDGLAAHGASLGAGIAIVLSGRACGVAETARVMRWLADQSARQCGPCVNGLEAIATTLEQVRAGVAPARPRQRLDQLAGLAYRRGACAHPDGAVRFLASALEVFAAEFSDHAQHGHCDACQEYPELPLPADATSSARETLLPC